MKKTRSDINLLVLLTSFAIVFLVAFTGNLLVGNATQSQWYESVKPSLTPPNYVFPIAWGILFILIAISLYLAWTSANASERKSIAVLFTANFLLNIAWSGFYFTLRDPALALIDLVALWISILALIKFLLPIDKKSAFLLVPYLLWVSFAGVLNYLAIAK